MTAVEQARLRLQALAQEHQDVDPICTAYGIDVDEVHQHAIDFAETQLPDLASRDADSIVNALAGVYMAGVLMGFTLAREGRE